MDNGYHDSLFLLWSVVRCADSSGIYSPSLHTCTVHADAFHAEASITNFYKLSCLAFRYCLLSSIIMPAPWQQSSTAGGIGAVVMI